tara:strand:- start:180 stop:662 length:483 start_codon:yes stop_codon:yes gene_type:complete
MAHGVTYDLKAARAKRKAAKAPVKAAKKTARAEKRAAKIKARGAKKANRLTTKAGKVTARATAKANKVSPAKAAPVSRAKKVTTAKTIKKVKTQRGTGNTYKAVWEANKSGVQKKYKSYADFRKAAVAYNSRKDSTGVMAPKKSTKAKPKKNTKAGPKNK